MSQDLRKPPGYMKWNPDCGCGWKMKRIYATVQKRKATSKGWRSVHRPIGWICPQCHTMVYGNEGKAGILQTEAEK